MSGDYQTAARMSQKRRAIPLPDLRGRSVLDIGCDHGYWSKLASDMGATDVLGIDRGRGVGRGKYTDLAKRNAGMGWPNTRFLNVNLGVAWPDVGRFDVVFCFAVYHHIYGVCRDHGVIWQWLRSVTRDELLWEGPLGTDDPIVRMRAPRDVRYNRTAILDAAAGAGFSVEVIGPALYRPTRTVLRCR